MISKKILLYALPAMVFFAAMPQISFAQRDKKKKPVTEFRLSEARLREAESFFTEAEKYFILEDYTKALFYFQRVVELNPENATVHYKIAEILAKSSKQEDLVKASISIENAIRFEKKNKYFYLLASSIYSSLGNFTKAELALETMMKEIKGTEEHLYELAALYQYDKKPDEAIKVYNRAEQAMGINEVSSLQKQKILLDQGKVAEAIAEGEKLIETFPDDERVWMGFAETLAQNGQREKGIQYLEKFIAENAEAGNAKMLLAGLYRDNNQEEKARTYIAELFDDPTVELGSKLLMLSTYSATLHQKTGKRESDPELEKFCLLLSEKLKRTHPGDPNVHILDGDLHLTLGHQDEARAEYLRAIQLGSTSFDCWQNLLYLESQLNQFDSLIVHSEKGLELFPNQAMLSYFNGYAHMRKKHYREATTSLEQAKKLSVGNDGLISEINSLLGDAYNGTKDYAKSDKCYEEALAFNPNNDLVLNNYSYYLALRKENLEKAEKMSAQLIKNNPGNSSYLDTYAWVLFMREKYKEAKKVMEKAIATGQAGAVHFEHYGDILFQLGEIDEAVKQWQKAKALDANNEQIDKKIANRRLY